MKTKTLPVIFLSIPFVVQPMIMARVSGSGRTIAGVSASVSSSADTGGNTGGSVTTGVATATSSSAAWVSEKNASIEGEASAVADGKKAEVKGASTGEDVRVERNAEDGSAAASVDIIRTDSGNDSASADAVADVGTKDGNGSVPPATGEGRRDVSDDGRSVLARWWSGVRGFFEKLAGKS